MTYVDGLIGLIRPRARGPAARKVLVTDTVHVVVFEFGAGQSLHEHAVHHSVLIQVLCGHARLSMESGETYEMRPGDLLHLTPMLRHEVDALEDTTLTVTMLLARP